MNNLYYLRINYEFTISFTNSHWIHCLLSQIQYEYTENQFREFETTMISLWYHSMLHDFTMNAQSFSRIRYLFREFSINTLSASRLNPFSAKSLSFSRIQLESTFFSQNHDEFTFLSRSQYEFTICFAISLFFHDNNINSLLVSRFY